MTCSECKKPKAPCLFTPKESRKDKPVCRKCVSDRNARYSNSNDPDKGTEMWRKSMKRHFL